MDFILVILLIYPNPRSDNLLQKIAIYQKMPTFEPEPGW